MAVPAGSAEVVEANLKVVGRSDLGGPGVYGDVTVVGTTAVVAAVGPPAPGSACPVATATVVDLKVPKKPTVAAAIPIPAGAAVTDLESLTVITPTFTGDLVAVALADGGCGPRVAGRVAYLDVTDPAAPRPLGQTAAAASVSLALRRDGRVLAARLDGAGSAITIDDLTDPTRPAQLAQWQPPSALGRSCPAAAGARLADDGEALVAVFADGRIYDLDLADPTHPVASDASSAAGPPAGGDAAIVPLGNRTVAVVADAPGSACGGDPPAESGLRILVLERGVAPQEGTPVRYPGGGGPGRLVVSGALAYVAWHEAGVRVVDLGEVRARTVGQFVPADANVVGVGLLPEHVVVTDAAQGLFVLERPDEGGGRAGFWSQFFGILPYFGFAAFASAALLVPRLAMQRARMGSRVGVPRTAPVPRRRA